MQGAMTSLCSKNVLAWICLHLCMLHVYAHVLNTIGDYTYIYTPICICIYTYTHTHIHTHTDTHTHIYLCTNIYSGMSNDFQSLRWALKTVWKVMIFKCHRCLSEAPDNNVLLLRNVEGYSDIQWCPRTHVISECRLCCCINHTDIPQWEYQNNFFIISLHWGWAVWQKFLWNWGKN